MVKIGCRLQSKLDPVRSLGSLGVHKRTRRMYQTFPGDDRSRQMEINFFVVVKMREWLTAIEERGKAIIASGYGLFCDTKVGNARDQLFA